MTNTALPPDRLSIGTCPDCGKKRYATRKDARRAARAFHRTESLRAYRCGDWHHYGHSPKWRKRGQYQ